MHSLFKLGCAAKPAKFVKPGSGAAKLANCVKPSSAAKPAKSPGQRRLTRGGKPNISFHVTHCLALRRKALLCRMIVMMTMMIVMMIIIMKIMRILIIIMTIISSVASRASATSTTSSEYMCRSISTSTRY